MDLIFQQYSGRGPPTPRTTYPRTPNPRTLYPWTPYPPDPLSLDPLHRTTYPRIPYPRIPNALQSLPYHQFPGILDTPREDFWIMDVTFNLLGTGPRTRRSVSVSSEGP
ncbi:hypothetical protein J6590_043179 [Homalodisca vitripennis]|nr:hypothetical protein J6590_043179 [Homalodisca vitripennis]